jgi:hypothetical protein
MRSTSQRLDALRLCSTRYLALLSEGLPRGFNHLHSEHVTSVGEACCRLALNWQRIWQRGRRFWVRRSDAGVEANHAKVCPPEELECQSGSLKRSR